MALYHNEDVRIMIPLRILGVAILSILMLIVISLLPIPVTFGTDLLVCPPGTFESIPTDSIANPLVIGGTTDGIASCQPCPAGFYCPHAGMGPLDPPIPCPSGFICPAGSIQPQAPPIPEYPLGLTLLAIFMIIAYGVIRRRSVRESISG